MELIEIFLLIWVIVLTIVVFYVAFKVGQFLALVDQTRELHSRTIENMNTMSTILEGVVKDVKTLAKFTHTHEGKPLYTFDIKDIN